MIFFLKWLFIGFAIGFFLFDNKCKNLREKLLEKYNEFYRPAVPYIKNTFFFFTPVVIASIALFSIIYHLCNSSFFDCIILSTVGFFSLLDFDKYHINGIFKIAAIFEYYLYSILFATLIGFLLNKAMENDKERKWEPIKNEAYNEIYTRSKNRSHYIAELLGHIVQIVVDPDESIDEKIDKNVADFIENSKLDCIDNIKVNEITENGIIKFRITEHEVIKFEIRKSKFENCNLKNRLKSISSEFSILQMKYQQYIEPEITTTIIKIQTNLDLAEDNISVYHYNNDILKNTFLQVDNTDLIRYIVFYLSKAAEFSQEASTKSKSKIENQNAKQVMSEN